MLNSQQNKFRRNFLSPFKQKFYYLKSLPIALFCGIKLLALDEHLSVTTVPFRWLNKNPFNSIYFAVLSMAAELSTAAPALLALNKVDADIAFIIIDLKAEFTKKAQSRITFTCNDYGKFNEALASLKQPGDTITVTAETVAKDADNNEVAVFYFTWSFKIRQGSLNTFS